MKDNYKKWVMYFAGRWKEIAAGISLLAIISIISLILLNGKEEITYRESTVVMGKLTVGVTESGNVNIGSTEQTFAVDISEYTESSNVTWNAGGMQGGMEQVFQNSAASSASATERALEIEAVYVTAGQEVEKGTSLLKLTDESVSNIRKNLEEDEAEAENTYNQLLTSQKKVKLQAETDLDVNKAYGTYADAEYTKTVNELERAAEDIQKQMSEKEEELEEKTTEYNEMQTLLAQQQEVLENAQYAKDNTDRESNLYWWIVAVNTVSDTKQMEETTEENIETAQEEIEQLNADTASLNTQLALAQKALASGKAEAETEKSLRQYKYENAQEIYDVTMEQSDFETAKVKTDYEEAKEKLDDFNNFIIGGIISSEYSGIITAVLVSTGSSLEENSSIITVNNYEEAQITVSVEEEDMDSAQIGNEVNVTFSAFPDNVFKGAVEEVGDAEINSHTNMASYSVTVAVSGDISGLYEGMSAEVTFITKETKEVLYISNRAVVRDGDLSYVKVRNESGRIEKKQVTIGFSDGINVEIKEGLSEGETVLIESSFQQ